MSRGELRENILAAKVERALRWAMDRRGPIAISAAAFVGVIMIGSVIVIRRQQARDTAEAQMMIAQSMIVQKRGDQAVALLKSATPAMSDRAQKGRALYLQGAAYISNKQYTEAEGVLRDALSYANTTLQPLILSTLGFALEQKGDYAGAETIYGRFMADHGNHFLAPRIQLGLGRSLLAEKKPDEARKAFGQIIDLYPASVWAQKAREMMGQSK